MRFAHVVGVVTGIALAISGCQRVRKAGQEREDCREDHTCDRGLQCLSNRCVRPPPADCAKVAEALASFDLGNYAPPEQRAPVVARYKTSCETAMVSKDEGACLDKATDKYSANACLPSMFPPPGAGSGTGDCVEVVQRVRQAVLSDVAGTDAQKMIDQMLPAMQASCTEDAWPEPLKQCIIAAKPGDKAGLEKCNELMPKTLQDKLQQRMMQRAPSP